MSTFDCDPSFDSQTAFTRNDAKTNSYSLLDGILISKALKSKVSRFCIRHNANNVSDHSSVELDMELIIQAANPEKAKQPLYVNWKKLSTDQKTMFRDKMTEFLASIQLPPNSLLYGNKCCSDNLHKFNIDNYFTNIVEAVLIAESVLPRTDSNVQRSFWNDKLMQLKLASIDCNSNWKLFGCPRSGPVFECKKKCHCL